MSDIELRRRLALRDIFPDGQDARGAAPQAASAELPDGREAPAISSVVLTGLVRLIDFALIAVVGLGVHLTYLGPAHDALPYAVAIIALSLVSIITFQLAGIYNVTAFRALLPQTARLFVAWTGAFGLVLAALFFAKISDDFSRVWLGAWFVLAFCALVGLRVGLNALVRSWTRSGRLQRRAVIVGGGAAAEELIRALDMVDSDVIIQGIFDDRGNDRSPANVAGYAKLGTVSDLVEFARRHRVDLLIVSLPITAETRVLQMLKKLWVLPVDIRLSAHTNRLRLRPRAYSYIGNVPMLDVFDRPMTDWNYVSKWLFDRMVGWGLLLAALPVMAVVALAIRLDSRGPVFFKQHRYGFNNELIKVFKFRSMYVEQSDATASKLVTKDDPRVTRVGRFIRKTSLDELPQLINVAIKGDLSLVGPRPHAVHAKAANQLYNDVVDGYFARHRVKPGITGWAQISGWRGETDTSDKIQRRVDHDLFYIENWSVLFDLYILVKTPLALLKTENAY